MGFSKSKKADLSLSINAIVILILAITILGLGLTFVRGLFKQAEQKVTEATSATEIANPPTRDNPMTVTPSEVTLRTKEIGKVLIAFMNIGASTASCALSVVPPTGTGIPKVDHSLASVSMEPDKINIWTAAVNPKGATPETYIFRFQMKCPPTATEPIATKDMIITVTI